MVDEGVGSKKLMSEAEAADFVEVAYARSIDEAEASREMLEERGIPALIDPSNGSARTRGIAVLVPAESLVEATELLAAKDEDEDEPLDDDADDTGDEDLDDDEDDFDDDDDDDFADDDDEDEEPDFDDE